MKDEVASKPGCDIKPVIRPQGELAVSDDQRLNIVFRSDDRQMFFKIKKTRKFRKLKQAWAEEMGARLSSFRMHYDGDLIDNDDNALTLGLEDHDVIEISDEQDGGAWCSQSDLGILKRSLRNGPLRCKPRLQSDFLRSPESGRVKGGGMRRARLRSAQPPISVPES